MGKHLLLVGGGHAHLTVLANLAAYTQAGHRVTLVSPTDHHYYSGMGPGMLSGRYTPQECRFNVRAMAEKGGAAFLQGHMTALEPERQTVHLDGGQTVGYDVCSFNTGSLVPPTLPGSDRPDVFAVKPIQNLLTAKAMLTRLIEAGGKPKVLVIGGGPAGYEIAGNVCALIACGCTLDDADVSIVPGRGLLHRFPEAVRRLAYRSLARRGIKIFDGLSVTHLDDGHAVLSDGLRVPYDVAFLAAGVAPQPDMSRFGLTVGPRGGMLVNEFLQSSSHPDLFGGGDCIAFAPQPLDKVGVYPVRQNPVLHHNLLAALDGRSLTPFTDVQGGYLLVFNSGDGRGIVHKGGMTFEGRTAFWLKDRIDRAFMRRFQLSGELAEEA